MSGMKTLRVITLVSVCAASVLARDNGCGPLEARRWGLLVGAGAAPGFFKNRGFTQAVDPYLGLASCPITIPGTGVTTLACDQVYNVLTTPENVFIQRDCSLPKFNKLFTNGVVHVTGQISYNVCNNTQYFLEGVYERATGSCVTYAPNLSKAPAFCEGGSCESSCSSSNSCNTSCTVSGTPLASFGYTAKLSTYQAYGGYIGARYYWNRVWCDRFSFFTGFKVGMLHRKQVCQNATIPASSAIINSVTYSFAARNTVQPLYCKSNAVSGGVQIGVDYCINDCWSVLVGVEFVATSPFKANRNLQLPIVDPTGTATGFGRNFSQLTNLVVAPTGALLQFPIWAGVRWEFDLCRNSCNEC